MNFLLTTETSKWELDFPMILQMNFTSSRRYFREFTPFSLKLTARQAWKHIHRISLASLFFLIARLIHHSTLISAGRPRASLYYYSINNQLRLILRLRLSFNSKKHHRQKWITLEHSSRQWDVSGWYFGGRANFHFLLRFAFFSRCALECVRWSENHRMRIENAFCAVMMETTTVRVAMTFWIGNLIYSWSLSYHFIPHGKERCERAR